MKILLIFGLFLGTLALWDKSQEDGYNIEDSRASRLMRRRSTNPCPSGWYNDGAHGLCYKVIHNVNYNEAKGKCANYGATIVKIDSNEKNTVIRELTKSGAANELYHGNTLIGAKKDGSTFYWPDETRLTYTRWAKNEPNNIAKNEDCISMYTDATIGYEEDEDQSYQSRWNDISCSSTQRVSVCEKKAISSTGGFEE